MPRLSWWQSCRRRWQGTLAPGRCSCGAYDLAGRVVCTCGGPCGVLACPACHGDGVPEAVAGPACAWVVHRRALRGECPPACHGDGVPVAVAGPACVGVVHLRGA
ncbi:MAG: hypothetical protein MSQ05_01260 [Akkermansia sp.]|nr:hypothetical protein [Akkermansia sp.]